MTAPRGPEGLRNLDLNLLVTLDALLRDANVTRAAERLQLTQPTVSASLARLRRYFGDDLLRRTGNQLQLTPLALRLGPLVGEALGSAERVFWAHLDFDPSCSQRTFAVIASDYGITVAGTQWSSAVSQEAPSVKLRFLQTVSAAHASQENLSRDVDGFLVPHAWLPPEMPHVDLFTDRWIIVADQANRRLSDRPTLSELSDAPWAATFDDVQRTPAGLLPTEWAAVDGQVQVVVQSFIGIPGFIRGTDRVALMQERLVHALPDTGLRTLPSPFQAAPLVLAFWWNPVNDGDLEHRWLREQLIRLWQPT